MYYCLSQYNETPGIHELFNYNKAGTVLEY